MVKKYSNYAEIELLVIEVRIEVQLIMVIDK